VIIYAVWLYFRFPLSLRMVEEMLAARGICVTYETVRQWGKKFGKAFSDQIRRRAPARGDKWYMDEVVVSIAANSTGSGALLIKTVSFSTSWSSVEETVALRSSA
jgi:putative transposase